MSVFKRRNWSRINKSAALACRPLGIEQMETRLLFHFFVNAPIADFTAAPGAPTTSINLQGVIDSDELTGTLVRMQTSNGNVDLHLFDTAKPTTVTNFLNYVNSDRYNNTIVHRTTDLNEDGLSVVQGGGYLPSTQHVQTDAPIQNEFTTNGVISNVPATIAMAKTSNPNSATSEWFINISDNSGPLDNPSNSGGFTVFGEVINGTFANAQTIEALPTFNFGSPFSELPLRNYTQEQFEAGTDPTTDNLVMVTDVSVVPEVSYTVSTTNPSLVTPTISGNGLTLTYAFGTTGSADVTVTGTGITGDVVTDTFTVTVATPVAEGVEVTIGDGAAKQVTYTDADGTVGTISLKGGTALVRFAGENLTQTTTNKGVTVSGPVSAILEIDSTNSTAASTLNVKAKGGDGALEINNITSTGAFKAIAGKALSVNGEIDIDGGVGKLDLLDITNGSIELGGGLASTINIGAADDTNIASEGAIKSIKLGRFGGSDGATQTLSAASIGKLTVTTDFAGDLTTSGLLSSAKVGSAQNGRWAIADLSKLTISGAMNNIDLVATNNIGKVQAGTITASTIFAGIDPGVAGALPDSADDFVNGASVITGVTVRSKAAGAFSNTQIAAANIGKVSLSQIETSNAGTAFGLSVLNTAKTITATTSGQKVSIKQLDDPTENLVVQDLNLRAI